jgi:hypothetical protein
MTATRESSYPQAGICRTGGNGQSSTQITKKGKSKKKVKEIRHTSAAALATVVISLRALLFLRVLRIKIPFCVGANRRSCSQHVSGKTEAEASPDSRRSSSGSVGIRR